MDIDLFSVEAKFIRAAEHFQSIEDEIVPWVNSDLHSVTQETNADFTELRLIYRCSQELVLPRISAIFGDAIHNLRSALDHLIYAIAFEKIGKSLPASDWNKIAKKIAFPITDCQENFQAFCSSKLSKLADAKLITKLETLQPYIRKHPVFPPLLALLRDLDDMDKHRLLHLAVIQATQWEYSGVFGEVPQEAVPIAFIPNDGELKNGDEILSVRTKCSAPNLNLNGFKLKLGVIVTHQVGPTGSNRSHLDSLYKALEHEVATVLDDVLTAV